MSATAKTVSVIQRNFGNLVVYLTSVLLMMRHLVLFTTETPSLMVEISCSNGWKVSEWGTCRIVVVRCCCKWRQFSMRAVCAMPLAIQSSLCVLLVGFFLRPLLLWCWLLWRLRCCVVTRSHELMSRFVCMLEIQVIQERSLWAPSADSMSFDVHSVRFAQAWEQSLWDLHLTALPMLCHALCAVHDLFMTGLCWDLHLISQNCTAGSVFVTTF